MCCPDPRAAAALLALALGCAGAPEPEIHLDRRVPAFELTGVPGEAPAGGWARAFTVHVAVPGLQDPPPVLGTYEATAAGVRFLPAYPLTAGLAYRAVYRGPGATLERRFEVPAARVGAAALVERVDPTADALPANLLRFYVHFSAPMTQGEAYRHLRLLEVGAGEVDGAFLELGEELWDPSGTRFTLLLDPGRVKRGLRPREELGPVLRAGRTYELLVDAAWPDARGAPLGSEHRKRFVATAEILDRIDPAAWRVVPPEAGGREPLHAHFPRPMDRALLGRMLRVVGPDGEEVEGKVEVGDAERRWAFTPDAPWREGGHALVADTALEDVCGNTIKAPFDVDVFAEGRARVEVETVRVGFEVGR